MGLGKTPIAIASAEQLREEGKISTALIVCPASLKYQWAQKIAEFTDFPTMDKKVGKETITVPWLEYCTIIDGDRETRNFLYNFARKSSARYIIIGYDNVLNDFSHVKKIVPGLVVLDEATAIKSFKAQRSKRIKRVLRSEYRLALTGTPIENKPEELFSIMQWVDESVLGRYDLFERAYITRNKYGWVAAYKNLDVLKARVDPAMSRLTDKDKSTQGFMPDVDESDWLVQMDEGTLALYQKIATDMLTELELISPYADFNISDYYSGMDESKPSGKLMGMYMCLEMLVNHPDLIIWSGMQFGKGDTKTGSRYAYTLWQSGALDELLYSPKLDKLGYELATTDSDKVLVFSKFKYMNHIIHVTLTGKYGLSAVQFHGGMSPVKKAEAVARFTNDPNCRFFLSSHAGAYGMDMHMSDLLVNYDLPWSAGKMDQINYRHRRRSSKFDTVRIRNMIMEGSFEERRKRILGRKKGLASAVLDGQGTYVQIEGDSLREHLEKVIRNGTMQTMRGKTKSSK